MPLNECWASRNTADCTKLTQFQYRQVKFDLERGVTPIHVYVEAEITKGKYGDYDTFIRKEAADLLKAYFETRITGG